MLLFNRFRCSCNLLPRNCATPIASTSITTRCAMRDDTGVKTWGLCSALM